MRLVLHSKVYSDVHAIMEYYERVASPELADDFYSELRCFMLEAAARPESFSSASVISAEPTYIAFLTISSSASLTIRYGFWLSDIIGGIHRSVFDVGESSPNKSLHTNRRSPFRLQAHRFIRRRICSQRPLPAAVGELGRST